MEIERKFLIREIPDLTNSIYTEISQGYLSYSPEIRIRKLANKYYLTEKSDDTLIREEIETEISKITYEILTSLIQGRIINKTRFFIPLDGKKIAELDFYHDELEGLRTVEVEFSDLESAQKFEVPSWFGEDITEDKRYKNKNLSRCSDVKELISQRRI